MLRPWCAAFAQRCGRFLRSSHFHLLLTLIWLGLAAPTLTSWRDSIPWLAFMSLYANVVGHFSAYQAARAEELIARKSAGRTSH